MKVPSLDNMIKQETEITRRYICDRCGELLRDHDYDDWACPGGNNLEAVFISKLMTAYLVEQVLLGKWQGLSNNWELML